MNTSGCCRGRLPSRGDTSRCSRDTVRLRCDPGRRQCYRRLLADRGVGLWQRVRAGSPPQSFSYGRRNPPAGGRKWTPRNPCPRRFRRRDSPRRSPLPRDPRRRPRPCLGISRRSTREHESTGAPHPGSADPAGSPTAAVRPGDAEDRPAERPTAKGQGRRVEGAAPCHPSRNAGRSGRRPRSRRPLAAGRDRPRSTRADEKEPRPKPGLFRANASAPRAGGCWQPEDPCPRLRRRIRPSDCLRATGSRWR